MTPVLLLRVTSAAVVPDAIWTGVLAALAAGVGIWFGHELGATEARRDRLRALYSEVMAAAIGFTPKSLGYKVSADAEIPEPHVIDGFVARLMVESEKDDDAVRTAFIGVFNFSMEYRAETNSPNAPDAELRKTAEQLKTYLTTLQSAMRERLAK